MWISLLQVDSILAILRKDFTRESLRRILDRLPVPRYRNQFTLEARKRCSSLIAAGVHGQLFEQNGELALRQIPEVLHLLENSQKIQIVLKSTAHFLGENWKTRN